MLEFPGNDCRDFAPSMAQNAFVYSL